MSATRGQPGPTVLRELASTDYRGLKGHRESKEREDRSEKVSLDQRAGEAWTGSGGSEDSRAPESKAARGTLGLWVFQGCSVSQEQEYRARRAWKDRGGHRGAEANQERAFLDPRGTRGCPARSAPPEREGPETPELRASRGPRGCLVCRVCRERTEPPGRRGSRELQVSGGPRGLLESASRGKRATKAKEE